MNSEIILVGNELLIGKIQDTNGQWMIHRLLEYGHQIRRITIIPDDIDIIADTINDSLKRHPIFILMSGGLGPTWDDLTFEGIAKAFGVKQVLNQEALRYIEDRYRYFYKISKDTPVKLDESRIKMASLPENAKMLKNPDGAAPSILIEHESEGKITRLISMPGIPQELQATFDEHVVPLVKELHAHYYQAGLKFEGLGESSIAKELKNLRKENQDVWIKTHPKLSKTRPFQLELHLTTFIDNDDAEKNGALKSKLIKLREKIKEIIEEKGGVVKESY